MNLNYFLSSSLSGKPIDIFLSILPGLVSALSNKSILLVADTKNIPNYLIHLTLLIMHLM